ncbi:hypothetical protein MOQ72_39850 [Saccharopolyspora sp. K220]|uniref:hypothetical protein n=1 Tax=Saccharopolyspora soli TaxID=2926618 RepID=UPI001F593C93|nr:hypothetical protein [Saccharopolyspora soli]MCI2423578.1 hypothetical protein [Saccharopolyspora soli]
MAVISAASMLSIAKTMQTTDPVSVSRVERTDCLAGRVPGMRHITAAKKLYFSVRLTFSAIITGDVTS